MIYLVEIKGASNFSRIARHTASSGMRTPTFFLDEYLDTAVPYLVHCFGNSLLAVKMNVYCYTIKFSHESKFSTSKFDEPNIPSLQIVQYKHSGALAKR